MPMIVNDRHRRLAFLFGRQSGLRSTGETLEQVQEQLRAEKAQHAFDNAYHQEQITLLLREIAELRYELAKRDREKVAEAPSPSTSLHSLLIEGPARTTPLARANARHDARVGSTFVDIFH